MKNHGVRVTLAAVGINLALGILYTWSVFSKLIPEDWGWSEADKSLPYAVACLVFSLMMVPAGRLQDRIGPRLVATFGGLLVGLGMVLASYTTTFLGYMIGFGVLAGAGIGFGYASATPPAVKWFPAARTGMIAGIVVSGFGLSPVYAAPLAKWMIATYGLPQHGVHSGNCLPGDRHAVVPVAGRRRRKDMCREARRADSRPSAGTQKKEDFSPRRCSPRSSSISCGSCTPAAPAPD